jgi:hypothetical protein
MRCFTLVVLLISPTFFLGKKACLGYAAVCGRLFRMTTPSENKTEAITVSELFPDLPENQLAEVRETLDEYCKLLLQIYDRLERERRRGFDDDLPGP